MAVYAISDLHLPGSANKLMDVFGENWGNHFERICGDWQARVSAEDVVLLPGDLSWAMTLNEAMPDLKAIAALPGRKIILRGNHDYWWSSVSQLRARLAGGMYALQNDAIVLDDIVYCGSRGWVCPGNVNVDVLEPAKREQYEQDMKVYRRELIRLRLTLDAARRLEGRRIIALMHYPPLTDRQQPTGFSRLLEEYGVSDVVYGHLHGAALTWAVRGEVNGIRYHQTSCDGLDFKLYELHV